MRFEEICTLFETIDATSKRLEKMNLVSTYLQQLSEDDAHEAFLLLQGSVFHPWEKEQLGIAAQLVVKAMSVAFGHDLEYVRNMWKKQGDLGQSAEELCKQKKQGTLFTEHLSLQYVVKTLRKLPSLQGEKSVDHKIKLIANLLTSATPLEARYIVRLVLADLRIGLGEGTLRDAISVAVFGSKDHAEHVQSAYDKVTDFGKVFTLAKKGAEHLDTVSLVIGRPFKVMLYIKAAGIDDAFCRVGKPCALEYKYDGFRILIHKGKTVQLFTRRLEEVTEQFPDVVEAARECIKGEGIFDAEAVGYNEKGYVAFQEISQRIRRKHNIHELAKKLPVEVNVFDVLYYEGEELLTMPFRQRRAVLEECIIAKPKMLLASRMTLTDNKEEAESFYAKALAEGFEGIMAKKLDGIYKPGARVGHGVKIKPTMEPIDAVIVKAAWGEGKRGQWLSSYTVAVQDSEGELLEIGNVSSGLKEIEGDTFAKMTEELQKLKISENDREVIVRPEIVLEIAYEEIQKSTTYSSTYALRFPRIVRVREDKPASEITSTMQVDALFHTQKGGTRS